MTNDYSSFGAMYGVETPVQGQFCTQPNGDQGVINDRGQCVAQAPLFAPSTMHLFNINNVPNPEYNLNASDYGYSSLGYIGNVAGVDNSGGVMPEGSLSGWDQAAMMDKARQEVERAYQVYLGREADSGGLDYWSEKVQMAALQKNPNEIKAIMDAIKNSPEGQAYAAAQAATQAEPSQTTPDPNPVEPPPPDPDEPPPLDSTGFPPVVDNGPSGNVLTAAGLANALSMLIPQPQPTPPPPPNVIGPSSGGTFNPAPIQRLSFSSPQLSPIGSSNQIDYVKQMRAGLFRDLV